MSSDDQSTNCKTEESRTAGLHGVSRRKFIRALGAAWTVLAAGGLLGGVRAGATAPSYDYCIAVTITELRASTSPNAGYIYYVTDPGYEGLYEYDPADSTSADNTGLILVSSSGFRFKRIVQGSVSVKWFGAAGDGTTDDTAAVQAAINAVKPGQTLLIPPGKYKISSVSISNKDLNITGGGTLYNGKLILVSVENVSIDGIRFEYAAIADGTIGIELQSVTRMNIRNCLFTIVDKAIYAKPVANAPFQQISRMKIHGNEFYGVNYAVYAKRDTTLNPSREYIAGDIQFINNQATCYVVHIYSEGLDGFICTGNTMFFPGHDEKSQTKSSNIYIVRSNWVVIKGNNLFEAGDDAIVLSQFENANIANNNIAWPGQRNPGSGIRLKDGGRSGSYCLSVVCGNVIMIPTLHGIAVEDACGYINIAGNQIRAAGLSDYYYGTVSLSGLTHYGITTASTTTYVNVVGNQASANNLNLLGNPIRYSDNIDAAGATVSNATKLETEAYNNPVFENGWKNYGFGNAVCQYYRDKQMNIYLKGVVNGGIAGTSIFTLPAGYRPAEKMIFSIITKNGYGKLSVDTNGAVTFMDGDPTEYISICGIAFK